MLRKSWRVAVGVLVLAMLARCGAPVAAGAFAAREAAVDVPADDAGVRARLLGEEAAWRSLAGLVQQRTPGGVHVDAQFVELVKQAGALAKRQRELIERGEDDPAMNRQSLERFGKLWASAA